MSVELRLDLGHSLLGDVHLFIHIFEVGVQPVFLFAGYWSAGQSLRTLVAGLSNSPAPP